MIELKQKDIKELAKNENVEDITMKNADDYFGQLDCVALSHGTYGNNGAVFIGNGSGRVYVITQRCSTLLRLV